jgi:hypothetical protein
MSGLSSGPAPAGYRELISASVLADDATLDLLGFDAVKYEAYEVDFLTVKPAGSYGKLSYRMSTDGGATFSTSTNYTGVNEYANGSTNYTSGKFNPLSRAWLTSQYSGGLSAELGLSGRLRIICADLALPTFVDGQFQFYGQSAILYISRHSSAYKVNTAVNGLRIYSEQGNLASGTVKFYGVRRT